LKAGLLSIVGAVVLLIPGSALSSPPSSDRALAHARHVVQFFERHPSLVVKPKGHQALFTAISVIDHVAQSKLARKHLKSRALAANRSWEAAVRYVRPYVGSAVADWMWNCSRGEGGQYGGPVWNQGGSGAYGWLQFTQGTFYGVIDKGISSAKAAGMIVPPQARSWSSPLGQAIAGAQMYRDGRLNEWTAPTC